MVAAMATVSGLASGLADIARLASESVESWLQAYEGYRGLIVLADEEGQRSQVITLWETHEAEAGARAARGAMRDQIAAMAGMSVVDFGVYEVAVFEIEAASAGSS
jgi:hypothetical protein